MLRTVVACLAVAALVGVSEAFKQRKFKRQVEENQCCPPTKYFVKLTTVTEGELPNEEGVVERTNSTTERYLLRNEKASYDTYALDWSGSLTYTVDEVEYHASYDDEKRCYTGWNHATQAVYDPNCIYLTYAGIEEVDGVKLSVFRELTTYEDGSTFSQVLLANVDDNGACKPTTRITVDQHKHDENATHIIRTTVSYEDLEVTPRLERFLNPLSPYDYCKDEIISSLTPDSQSESESESESASASESESDSGSGSSESAAEVVLEQASESEAKRAHAKSRRSFAKAKRFGF